MLEIYEFGCPEYMRKSIIKDAISTSNETYPLKYHGKYRSLPVVEIRIEVPVYRLENVRTKNLQKEWLVRYPELPKDIFTVDPSSIEAQENQHLILSELANKEGLWNSFKDESLHQTEPIICSDNGIVVNGNRRLCTWRSLYYSNNEKYKHFETIRVAVLPDHDPSSMYDLEVELQIRPDMKAEYAWHAVAADCKEKADLGIDLDVIAKKQGKNGADEVRTLIDCYDYAAEYLDGIHRPDEWSLVDKSFYAFKQIVQGRKSIGPAGDKILFQEITNAILQVPAKGERLYSQIPKVVKYLDDIAPKLKEVFNIEDNTPTSSDIVSLLGDDDDNDTNSAIAAGIRCAGNPELVVETIKSVLDTQEELAKEIKRNSYVFDQVKKAATYLNNAVSNLNDSMTKNGISKQLESIEATVEILRDWIK